MFLHLVNLVHFLHLLNLVHFVHLLNLVHFLPSLLEPLGVTVLWGIPLSLFGPLQSDSVNSVADVGLSSDFLAFEEGKRLAGRVWAF